MNVALRIIAGLLAAAILPSGAMNLFQSKEKLVASGVKFSKASAPAASTPSALEALGAVGLILPAALDIAPVLVPLAAVGLVVMVVGAIIVQVRRHDAQAMVANLAMIALAGFVVWGPLRPKPLTG